LISVVVISNLFHIDLVVSVRANPPDPHNALLEIDGYDQPIVVSLDVEYNPVCRHDAGGSIATLYIRGAGPPRLLGLIEPCIECRLQRSIVLISSPCLDEFGATSQA
jgi:hypothetical protein